MEDEGSAHSEDSTEEAGFEDDVVSRRSLTGFRGSGCGRAGGRPVVPGEHERGEVDFMRELEEAVQRGGPGIEGRRPGLDVRDVFETAGQRLQQLLLLSRRAEEDARLVHPFLRRLGVGGTVSHAARRNAARGAAAYRVGGVGSRFPCRIRSRRAARRRFSRRAPIRCSRRSRPPRSSGSGASASNAATAGASTSRRPARWRWACSSCCTARS